MNCERPLCGLLDLGALTLTLTLTCLLAGVIVGHTRANAGECASLPAETMGTAPALAQIPSLSGAEGTLQFLCGDRIKVEVAIPQIHPYNLGEFLAWGERLPDAAAKLLESLKSRGVSMVVGGGGSVDVKVMMKLDAQGLERTRTLVRGVVTRLLGNAGVRVVDEGPSKVLIVSFDQWLAVKKPDFSQWSSVFVIMLKLADPDRDVVRTVYAPGLLRGEKFTYESIEESTGIMEESVNRSLLSLACELQRTCAFFSGRRVGFDLKVTEMWNRVLVQEARGDSVVGVKDVEVPAEQARMVVCGQLHHALAKTVDEVGGVMSNDGDSDLVLSAAYADGILLPNGVKDYSYFEIRFTMRDRQGTSSATASFRHGKEPIPLGREPGLVLPIERSAPAVLLSARQALPFLVHTLALIRQGVTESVVLPAPKGGLCQGVLLGQASLDPTYGYVPDNPIRLLSLREVGPRVYFRHLLDRAFKPFRSTWAPDAPETLRIGNVGIVGPDRHVIDVYALKGEAMGCDSFVFVDFYDPAASILDTPTPHGLYFWK